MSEEQKQKRWKSITVDGVQYESVQSAVDILGVCAHTLKKMMNDPGHKVDENKKAKKCVVDGIEYKSLTAAAKAHGTYRQAISRFLNTGNRCWE